MTQTENVRLGRVTKLTAEQVQIIKDAIPTMKWGGRKILAKQLGISPQLISDIKHGRAWVAP